MKIKTLSLQNVGPFGKVEIEFHGGLNVITGANGTGKSLLLSAAYRMITGVDETQGPMFLKPYFRPKGKITGIYDYRHTPIETALSFNPQDDATVWESPRGIRGSVLRPSIRRYRQPPKLPSIVYISPSRGDFDEQQTSVVDSENWRQQPTGERFRHLHHLLTMISNEPDHLDVRIKELMIERFKMADESLIHVTKTRTVPNTLNIAADIHSLGADHEIRSAASGCVEIVFIVAETAFLTDSMIIIDEPELHLHPAAQDMMADYLCYLTTPEGGNNQVILGTHSLSMIYGHSKGKVINLRKQDDSIVAELIINDGVPTAEYEGALKQLGYSKNALMAAVTFWKKYKKEHKKWIPPDECRGLWEQP